MTRPAVPDRRPVALYAIGAVLLLSGAYLLFELGRYQGGYSLLDQRRERAAAAQALAERDARIEELQRQITVLETSREIDRETYAQVEDNLGQLQARIQAQEEELAFYRGIVSPADGVAGLRIQSLEVAPADAERRYVLRIVLVQAIIHDRRVAGVVRLNVMGHRAGEVVELGLRDLVAEGAPGELPYGFRYFQGLQRELVLPVGFEPDRVNVEIWPREPRGDQISRSFQWDAIVT